MVESAAQPSVLFLTVGSGNPAKLEETLYIPISKSISTGDWQRVVLLPSQETLEHARKLKERHPQLDVHIKPLPHGVSESDADACYNHFQSVIAELGLRRSSPANMAVDITRGTKAMSAALLLAAFRHRIAKVRYVEGDRNSENPGIVVPGSERVRDIHADIAFNHRALDEAHLLFLKGNFAAASSLLGWLSQGSTIQAVSRLCDFYSAWDRFDYKSADEINVKSDVPDPWGSHVPPDEVRRWVHQLAQPSPQRNDNSYKPKMAERLRLLIVDLLANGERRVRQRQFEDAILRAYRVLEMLGQARLFDRDFDSSALPADDTVIKEFKEELAKEGSQGFGVNKDESLNAGRELVARLLKRLGDPLAQKLLKIGDSGALRITSRNRSILIHGYVAVGPDDKGPLDALYKELRSLLCEDRADFEKNLKLARFPDFSASAESSAL